ncbi:hypothetical protein LDENG_00251430, partial [Lucifuga dentata]
MLADPGPLYSDFPPVLLPSDQPSESPVLLGSDLPLVLPEFLCSSPLSELPDILGSERSSELPVQPGLLGLDQPLESSVLLPMPTLPGFQRLGWPPSALLCFKHLGRPPESSAPPGFQRLGPMPLALPGFKHSGRPPESSALSGLGYLDRPGFQRPGQPPDFATKPDSWRTGCPLELSSLLCPPVSCPVHFPGPRSPTCLYAGQLV